MSVWWSNSPYFDVGFYLNGGLGRTPPTDNNLDAGWVADINSFNFLFDTNVGLFWPLDQMVPNGLVAVGLNDEAEIVGDTLMNEPAGIDGLVAVPQH